MYTGFSAVIVSPQEIPTEHGGKLIRLPFTSLTARRKSALGFSRPSLACIRKDLGHGLMPPDPPAGQSGSSDTAAFGKFAKSVLAVTTPVLSLRLFGNVCSP